MKALEIVFVNYVLVHFFRKCIHVELTIIMFAEQS